MDKDLKLFLYLSVAETELEGYRFGLGDIEETMKYIS